MILVFDLDDTLYPEMSYVRSGFAAVATFASNQWGVDESEFLRTLHRHLETDGRGKVFDQALWDHGIHARAAVRRCLSTYRAHWPAIGLSDPARRCIERFVSLPKFVVTDGNALVQERKAEALGLSQLFRKVLVTHRYGRHHAKPSPHCLIRISRSEGVNPARIFYIADNAQKDFVGIRPLGFRSIRLLEGPHAEVPAGPYHEAEISIKTLDELTWDLLDSMVAEPVRDSAETGSNK